MKKWQYGLAVYSRRDRGQHKPVISTDSGTLPMEGFHESERLFLDVFLKLAGERGWELASVTEPFAKGYELSEEVEGKHTDQTYRLEESGDVQWFIFKREA